jgi:hypothetical protein
MRGSPRLRYVPSRLSMVPALFRRNMAPDLVVLHTSLPRDEQVSLGTEVNVLPAAIEAVRRTGGAVIAQANPRMPFTYGDGVIPRAEIDLLVEVDEPLGTHVAGPVDEASVAIGRAVGARVPDGATPCWPWNGLAPWTWTSRSRPRSSSAPRSSTTGWTAMTGSG